MIPFRFQDLYISLIWASKSYPTSTWLLTSLRVCVYHGTCQLAKNRHFANNCRTASRKQGWVPVLCYDSPVPSQTHRGKFITIEGLDGCGKSTQLEKLAKVLRKDGLQVVVTREPGGTPTGDKIRRLLLDTGTANLSPYAELALMFASRAQHIKEIIQPGLAEGKIVLCDRFTDSTEAYQGGGRKLGSEPVLLLHRVLCGNLQPDLTILMDSDVSTSVEKARRRNKASRGSETDENRFEQESRAFFSRVRNTYLAIASREKQRVTVVDARGPAERTHKHIVAMVRRKLKVTAKSA
jgi:dTMP kinase